MKPSLKAALFSGLVCPGAGHLLLKNYRRGLLLLGIALLALYVLAANALQVANSIAAKIASGELPLDPQAITVSIDAALSNADSTTAGIASWVLLGCWLFGIVDSYRLGRALENNSTNIQ